MRFHSAGRGRTPGASLACVLTLAALLPMPAGAQATDARPAPFPARVAPGTGPGPQPGADPMPPRPSPLDAASAEVRDLAAWVARTGDNEGMPYVIVDKVNATVFVLDANGHLDGEAPALLGLVKGDGDVPGIGDRALAAIAPGERSTPAGRFVASLGRDLHGQDILWIDYANAIALHRVVKGTPAERRAQRLESPTADDNRISYGCINVPVKFYDAVVHPAFAATSGIVYILPETRPAREVFGAAEGDGNTPSAQGAAAGAAPGIDVP